MDSIPSSYINAIGTAVPAHVFPQTQIANFMADALQLDERGRRRLNVLYRQTRINQRHSVLPDYGLSCGEYTFYPNTPDLEPFPTVSQRMAVYRQQATPLALAAVQSCLADRNSEPDLREVSESFQVQQITHIITVSCTGLYAPGPDIELIEALGLPGTTQRLAINFMGCYGAFNGLKAADAIVRADPGAVVLVVCIELCTLHFQKSEETDSLLSNALFADGAAAVLIESQPRPDKAFRLRQFYCDLLPEGKAEMAWNIGDHGFEMTLTSEVPAYIQKGIGKLLTRLLKRSGLTPADISHYALHPGGKRILEVIETQLGISANDNRYAYNVLQQYGNMSSATVLFVLKEIWTETEPLTGGAILSCAFGPGLTLESMLLEVLLTEEELVEIPTSIRSSASIPA